MKCSVHLHPPCSLTTSQASSRTLGLRNSSANLLRDGTASSSTRAGKKVFSTYLVCEAGAVLPAAMQREMVARAGSKVVETCKAGHMAIVGEVERVGRCVRRAASEEVAEDEEGLV